MAKSPDEIVAEIDRKQNEEDLDLPRRAGEAIVKGAKAAKDFVVESIPKAVKNVMDAREASQLPMEKKAKGGKISSASKRADGIAIRGKTRGTMASMCGGGYMKKGKK
jgi:hypothetical protein